MSRALHCTFCFCTLVTLVLITHSWSSNMTITSYDVSSDNTITTTAKQKSRVVNIKPQITISPAALEENVPEKTSPKTFQDGLLCPHIKAPGIDPFSHKLSPGILDLIKIIIASFTLAPLRLYCIFNLLCLTWFVAKIGLLCTNNKKTNEKPFSGWRRVLQIFIRKVFRAVFFCMGFHSIKISGDKSSKEKAPILVCAPHATIVDAIAVFASGSVPVAKQGVAKMYFIGPVFSFIQSLFVTREAASSRQQTVDQIKSRACDLEAETSSSHKWPQVFIFPEGTCTNSRALIKFKSGAFQPSVPVQPVLIKRDLNTLDTLTWTWNQSYGELVCLWLTCCQFSNSIEIEFMKVYEPNLEEREDPRLFASNVRALMAARLGIPTVERSVSEFTNDGGSAWSINNQKTSSKVQEYPYVIDFVGNLTQT